MLQLLAWSKEKPELVDISAESVDESEENDQGIQSDWTYSALPVTGAST